METRLRCCCIVFLTTCCWWWSPSTTAAQHQVQTTNFVVIGPDAHLVRKIATEAERFRRELAIEWLGHELPTWNQKCPIRIRISMHAGGETSFAFLRKGRSEPIDWDMQIFGPPDRLLDAVLPHEVTHTIFATHFGRPLPRWADEGACTTVEHATERAKNHQMLIQFLSEKPSRGIPFNRMFTMRDYPHDILPLYAQGYSLAKFLIAQKGKRHFVDYIHAGIESEVPGRETRCWDRVTSDFYGFRDLSDLQISWLNWVKNGSGPVTTRADVSAIAGHNRPTRSATSSIAGPSPAASQVARQSEPHPASESWYLKQARLPDSMRTTTNRAGVGATNTLFR